VFANVSEITINGYDTQASYLNFVVCLLAMEKTYLKHVCNVFQIILTIKNCFHYIEELGGRDRY
jgi:hypothetical protein